MVNCGKSVYSPVIRGRIFVEIFVQYFLLVLLLGRGLYKGVQSQNSRAKPATHLRTFFYFALQTSLKNYN